MAPVRSRWGRRGQAQPTKPAGAPPTPASGPPLWAWGAVGLAGSLGLALFGTRVGAHPDGTGWWFSLPRAGSVALGVPFYASAVVLLGAWLGVGRWARAGKLGRPAVVGLLGAWGIPLALGPPLFSRDLYSYVAQGLLAHDGLNPYAQGPASLGPGPVLESVASVWRHTPAPYGPLFVSAARGVAAVFGTSLTGEILALRALELVGVSLLVVYLPRLARSLGAEPGTALWLGVLSPLALFSFVASGHNDGLMLGLVVAGLAYAAERRPLPALVLCALAVTVKIPAAAALAFVALGMLRASAPGTRLRTAITVVVIPTATVVAVTVLSGLGWSWLGPGALKVPTELRVLPTPSVAVGTLLAALAHLVGAAVRRAPVITVVQVVFGATAVVAVVWLATRVRRADEVRLIGCALAVLVLASPTVWPWYLLWALTLVAATPAQRSRVVVAGAGLAMLVVGPSGTPVLQGDAYLLVVAACAAGIVWLARRRRWQLVALGAPA